MKALNTLGVILFFIGTGLVFHSQLNLETTVESTNLLSMESSEYSSDRIYNIGLVYQKLNLTLVGGIILISGLVMACAVEGKK